MIIPIPLDFTTIATENEEFDATITLAVIKKYVAEKTAEETLTVKTAKTTPLTPSPSSQSRQGPSPSRSRPQLLEPGTTRKTLTRNRVRCHKLEGRQDEATGQVRVEHRHMTHHHRATKSDVNVELAEKDHIKQNA